MSVASTVEKAAVMHAIPYRDDPSTGAICLRSGYSAEVVRRIIQALVEGGSVERVHTPFDATIRWRRVSAKSRSAVE